MERMNPIRWKVACINWGRAAANHAMAYALVNGEMRAEAYFPTWAEALAHAERMATPTPPDPAARTATTQGPA